MSKNIPTDIISKFNERMNKRVASTRSGRFDLRLSDYDVLDDREATILVTYDKGLGIPKRSQLDEWVTSSFNGQMLLDVKSTRVHPEVNAVVAIARKNEIRRPIEHTAELLVVGKDRYRDDSQAVWEVHSNDNGDRYLVRVAKDDIEAILRERQTDERTASIHHRVRLSDIRTAGITDLEVGDRVAYMCKGGILQRGEITHVSDDMIHVRAPGNSTNAATHPSDKVKKEKVVYVYEKSPKSQKAHDRFLVDFFTKAYGDAEFARKFVTLKGANR